MRAWLPNAISFQIVWIAAVAGAAHGWWWSGPLALFFFAAWQLPASRWPRADCVLMVGAAVTGFALDSLWVQVQLMQFSTPLPWHGAAPVWIVAMWMGFALTLNHSLATLKRHLWWAALLGSIGGPIAYAIADRTWAAVDLMDPDWPALLALSVAWGVITPLLLVAASHLQRRASTPVTAP